MQETITIHSAGAIPGIPGELTPGTYLLDWETRTATLIPQEQSPEEAQPVETPVVEE